MPTRLTVIMIQASPLTSAADRLSQQVVGELIGVNGIDLTLIDSLEGLDPTSTDRLTLDSISGDVAVLNWASPAETVKALSDVGFSGSRAPHSHDRNADSPERTDRRIYAFNMNTFDDVNELISALNQLRTSQSTATFTIGTPSSLAKKSPDQNSPSDSGTAAETDSGITAEKGPIGSKDVGPSEPTPPTPPSPKNQSIDLDRLLDELDQLDP